VCVTWYLSITGTLNNLVGVEVALCANKLEVNCRLLTSFVGTALCEIAYGTDPTRKQLPFIDVSKDTGLSGELLLAPLSSSIGGLETALVSKILLNSS